MLETHAVASKSPTYRRSIRAVLAVSAAVALSTSSACTSSAPAEPDEEPVEIEAPPAPRYVVVSRTTRLYLAPKRDARYLQFETREAREDRREARRASLEELRAEAVERAKERAEEEEERLESLKEKWRDMEPEKRDASVEAYRQEMAEAARDRARRAIEARVERARQRTHGHPAEQMVALRLVEERADWAVVETLVGDEAARQCHRGAQPGLAGMALRLYVPRDELETVTTQTVHVRPERWTEVVLKPGVPVRREEERTVVFVDGFRLELAVPEDAVGTSFESNGLFRTPETDTLFTARALVARHLRLDDRQFVPFNPWYPLYVTEMKKVDEDFYVTTRTPCGEYTVAVAEDDIRTDSSTKVTHIDGGRPTIATPHTVAGAELFTPSGREIGTSITAAPLGAELDEAPEGRRCFRQPVWTRELEDEPAPHRSLEICVESGDVVDDDDSP
jgi:hypothetical protein